MNSTRSSRNDGSPCSNGRFSMPEYRASLNRRAISSEPVSRSLPGWPTLSLSFWSESKIRGSVDGWMNRIDCDCLPPSLDVISPAFYSLQAGFSCGIYENHTCIIQLTIRSERWCRGLCKTWTSRELTHSTKTWAGRDGLPDVSLTQWKDPKAWFTGACEYSISGTGIWILKASNFQLFHWTFRHATSERHATESCWSAWR